MYNLSVEGSVEEETFDWLSQEKQKRGFQRQPAVWPYSGQFSEIIFGGLIYYKTVNNKGIIKIR